MHIYIENEYPGEIDLDYTGIITSVIQEALDYVSCPYECEVNVTLTDNNTIHQINKEQRDMDKPTDVLSFPMLEYEVPGDFTHVEEDATNFEPDSGELILGDIVISYDKVLSQAAEYNHSCKRELAFLVAHSMLHLFGYDHMEEEERRDMERRQHEILEHLGIART